MYITDLVYFVKDAFNKDKKVKLVNQGNKIILNVFDRDDIIKKEPEVETVEVDTRKTVELPSSSETNTEINYEVVSNRRSKPVEEEPQKTVVTRKPKGFAKKQVEETTLVLEPSGYCPTDNMSREEQVTEFLRRIQIEKAKEEYEAKVKKINK